MWQKEYKTKEKSEIERNDREEEKKDISVFRRDIALEWQAAFVNTGEESVNCKNSVNTRTEESVGS